MCWDVHQLLGDNHARDHIETAVFVWGLTSFGKGSQEGADKKQDGQEGDKLNQKRITLTVAETERIARMFEMRVVWIISRMFGFFQELEALNTTVLFELLFAKLTQP